MTNEQAIDLLDNLIGFVEDNQDNDYDEALKMAIEALYVQPAITFWLKQLQEQIASEPESISKSARLSLIMYIIDEVNTI